MWPERRFRVLQDRMHVINAPWKNPSPKSIAPYASVIARSRRPPSTFASIDPGLMPRSCNAAQRAVGAGCGG